MEVDPRRENGDVTMTGEVHFSQTEPSPNSSPDPGSIAAEIWEMAEEATHEIICRIHPTIEDDQKRKQVIEYVQGLIKCSRSLDFQIFPYGSVPLKTYLPDGDIDLTVISSPGFEDTLVSEVHTVLKAAELNQNASYEVKDIRFIDAEVKLVKCFVHNIVVDISFNQLGGLSTLCFLEKVDRLVGKNHLFKRSIILIKAWCYYESRILGAHHGLISTYALEILILCIFHLFHRSLNGPLAVLYRFLDYFSKFDWDNFVVSLNGPVCKSSLPRNYAEPLESKGELLFSDEFLKECVQMFTVPSRNLELNSRPFTQKYLNIIDPLKENNNLGRSVNRANFYRVRSAFKYGARKLGQILVLPKERIADEFPSFFANTLVGYGSNDMNEIQNLSIGYGSRISDNVSSLLQSNISSSEGTQHSRLANQTDRNRPSCSGRSPSDYPLSQVAEENGVLESMISCGEMMAKLTTDDKMKCRLLREPKDHSSRISNPVSSRTDREFTSPSVAETPPLNDGVLSKLQHRAGARETAIVCGNSQPSTSLLDLTGDYDSHFGSLVYVQHRHLYPVSASVLPSPPIFPQSLNKNPLEPVSQSLQFHQNGYSLINVNGVLVPQLYYMNHLPTFNTSFGSEEKKNRRGTGTYIPNVSPHSNRDGWFPSRREKVHPQGNHGSSQRHAQDNMISGQLHRHKNAHDNGALKTRKWTRLSDHVHDLSEAENPYLGNDKPTSPQPNQSHPVMRGTSKINGFSHPSEKIGSKSEGFKLHERPSPERLNSYSGTSDPPSSPELVVAQSPE